MVEQNVTLNIVYQHILAVEYRLKHIEDLLEIPEEKLSEEELKEFKEIRQEMLEHGGTSIEEMEKERKANKLEG